MNEIKKIKYHNEIEGFWAVPTSGFGHLCDEQPLPYLRRKDQDLTPRLGGEINANNYSERIIPLPYGKLSGSWPKKQKFFNFTRRKINIYWKNIFKSRCNKERIFYFYDQLNYKGFKNGFEGKCPILTMKRIFQIEEKRILVKDIINFKENLEFNYFHLNPYIFFKSKKEFVKISTSNNTNYQESFKSSTGEGVFSSYLIKNCKFKKSEIIRYSYEYKFNFEK